MYHVKNISNFGDIKFTKVHFNMPPLLDLVHDCYFKIRKFRKLPFSNFRPLSKSPKSIVLIE